jgi:hypothetical protein
MPSYTVDVVAFGELGLIADSDIEEGAVIAPFDEIPILKDEIDKLPFNGGYSRYQFIN